ncbi:hypothetical protein EOM86_12745, partial [Candidatus Nomurabacteria bacterium]|nr:hypothetical protein [Candidatus Nomurabacteria bacterium]
MIDHLLYRSYGSSPTYTYYFDTYDFNGLTVTYKYTQDPAYFLMATFYTVTFKNYDDTVLGTQTVCNGGTAESPAVPPREDMSFVGWSSSIDNITSDMTVTAQYSSASIPEGYRLLAEDDDYKYFGEDLYPTIYFNTLLNPDSTGGMLAAFWYDYPTGGGAGYNCYVTWDSVNELVYVGSLDEGYDVVYENGAWNCDSYVLPLGGHTTVVHADIPLAACLYVKDISESDTGEFTVTFKDYDGTVLDIQHVALRESAIAPNVPSRPGYVFANWDTWYGEVYSDLVVTACYLQGSGFRNIQVGDILNIVKVNPAFFSDPYLSIWTADEDSHLINLNATDYIYGGGGVSNSQIRIFSSSVWGGYVWLYEMEGGQVIVWHPVFDLQGMTVTGIDQPEFANLFQISVFTVIFNDYDGTVIDTQY